MKLDLQEHCLVVTREPHDPTFRDSEWGSGESRLLYHIKKQLNSTLGLDLIKTRMWKDGHMVDSDQLYLRTRSKRSPKPHIMIWNIGWQVQDAASLLKEHGKVTFSVVRDCFDKEG